MYFDFSKAFDTVSYKTIVMKLSECGVDESIMRWTENWLTGRVQSVVISSIAFLCVRCSAQLSTISKLAEVAHCPLIQVTDEDAEQVWT